MLRAVVELEHSELKEKESKRTPSWAVFAWGALFGVVLTYWAM